MYGHPCKWASWRKWDRWNGASFENLPDMSQHFHQTRDSYAFGMIFLRIFHLADPALMVPTQYFDTITQSFRTTVTQELKLYLAGIDITVKRFTSTKLPDDIGEFIVKTVIDEWKYFANNGPIKKFYDACNNIYTRKRIMVNLENMRKSKLTYPQLIQECKICQLRRDGNGTELLNRLFEYEKIRNILNEGNIVKTKCGGDWKLGIMVYMENKWRIVHGFQNNQPFFIYPDISTDQITLTFLE